MVFMHIDATWLFIAACQETRCSYLYNLGYNPRSGPSKMYTELCVIYRWMMNKHTKLFLSLREWGFYSVVTIIFASYWTLCFFTTYLNCCLSKLFDKSDYVEIAYPEDYQTDLSLLLAIGFSRLVIAFVSRSKAWFQSLWWVSLQREVCKQVNMAIKIIIIYKRNIVDNSYVNLYVTFCWQQLCDMRNILSVYGINGFRKKHWQVYITVHFGDPLWINSWWKISRITSFFSYTKGRTLYLSFLACCWPTLPIHQAVVWYLLQSCDLFPENIPGIMLLAILPVNHSSNFFSYWSILI